MSSESELRNPLNKMEKYLSKSKLLYGFIANTWIKFHVNVIRYTCFPGKCKKCCHWNELGKPKYVSIGFFFFNLWHWQRWPFSLEFLGILLRMFLVNWAHNAIRKICKLENFKIEVRRGFSRKEDIFPC